MPLFTITQIIYWLGLATWFGGVLFIAMSAPIIFRTIRGHKPLLPTVLSVNLENQHADLLAGEVVSNLLAMLWRIQIACAAAVLVGLAGQWKMSDRSEQWRLTERVLRSALFLLAVIFAVYEGRVLWPQSNRFRQEYLDHADDPEVANPAKDKFDQAHQQSVTVLMITLCALLGMVLCSGDISSSQTFIFK
jgi:hypothetical protein